MKKIVLLLALVLFPVIALAKGLGYSNTQWGMNPEQVVKAEKGKAQIIKPKKYDSGLSKVQIEDLEIDKSKYTVNFIFDNSDQLIETIITSNEKESAGIINLQFSSLNKLLSQKYGKPQFSDEKTVTWKTNSTTIELSRIAIASISFAQVSVSYYPNSKATIDASKL
ncbi:hypothetical protein ACG9XP_19050 [Acinetobacter baumannii]|uniref:hypothetical protein n=1 Tax=Acinetobacter baumannii TaxID=470 RepID=UPI003AF99C0A